MGARTIYYKEICFIKNEFSIDNKKFKYYTSPILCENKFTHGFFTKSSCERLIPLISSYFNKNYKTCFLNQIHSNRIYFGSNFEKGSIFEADGILSDIHNQNLWVYTADCMPIFFADKRKRIVAAIHCGRKGLEKKIIKNLIKIFDKKGSLRNDIIVSIGPSISKANYSVDRKTYKEFLKNADIKRFKWLFPSYKNEFNLSTLNTSPNQNLIQLNLKKHAYKQLINENIPSTNIDISNICTYETKNEFNSWRRSKTSSRQWNFICT